MNCYWLCAVFSSLAAFITGFSYGASSGVLEMDGYIATFSSVYNTTNECNGGPTSSPNSSSFIGCNSSIGSDANSDGLAVTGLYVAAAPVGSLCASLLAGWVADRFSRKYGLFMGGIVTILSAALMSSAYYIWMIILGRLLLGVMVGLCYVVMPIYISEMSLKQHRGKLLSVVGQSFQIGLLVSVCLNIFFAKFCQGWRIAFVPVGVMGLIYAIGMAFMPHSPRWLVKRGREKEALAVLSQINGHSNKEEFVDSVLELKELRGSTTVDSLQTFSFIFKQVSRWKYRFLVCCITYFLAANGGTFVLYYTPTFFCEVDIEPFYGALFGATVSLAASVLGSLIIDKVGRKSLFLVSILLMSVSGLAVALLQHLSVEGEVAKYSVVVLICLYSFGFTIAWLTLPWVYCGEIFPTDVRGLGFAVGNVAYWIGVIIVNQTTPFIVFLIELHGFFYILSGVNLLAFFFVLFILPETKGVSLEEVGDLFSQSIWQRFTSSFKCDALKDVTPTLHTQQTKEVEEMNYDEIKCEMSEL